MPTLEHEATAQLFHDNHELAPFLLASLGIFMPAGEVTIGDSNLSTPDAGLALPDTQSYVLEQLARTDPKHQASYASSVLQIASEAARHAMEESMQTKYRTTLVDRLLDEGKAEGRTEGIVQGEADMFLHILGARGFDVPASVSASVRDCANPELLETWASRAISATTLDEVFAE